MTRSGTLRVRWLGRVGFEEAYALQRALHEHAADDYLLLLEHPDVITLGVRGDERHILVDAAARGVPVVRTDRGGDVTYHGPGQVVAYPIVSVPEASGPGAGPVHVRNVEQLVIDVLGRLGVRGDRLPGYPGVWVGADTPTPRKICAIGVRVSRGRTLHGLALNVDPDLAWFERIVPCGIADKAVTSLGREGSDATVADVVDLLAEGARQFWGHGAGGAGRAGAGAGVEVDDQRVATFERRAVAGAGHGGGAGADRCERQDGQDGQDGHDGREGRAGPREGGGAVAIGADPGRRPATAVGSGERPLNIRLRQAGVDPDGGVPIRQPKPAWLRVPAHMGEEFLELKATMRGLDLVTVCEEAGCPNIFECWGERTATFMINGERCTRACGFCLVDTRHPLPLDPAEPAHVAAAVARMGLAHAVVTAVARDDLADGGAAALAATVSAIRARCPGTTVEVLIPDCKGDARALDAVFAARPDVLNHNLETVARLQRAVRPSAGYARSLAVLARSAAAGLVTKAGLVLGMGEERHEVVGALHDLAGVGVDIVTMGQYLRPTARHLPVARFLTPDEFASLGELARSLGFAHVESSPLTRSSHHARSGVEAARRAGRHGGRGAGQPVPVTLVAAR